MSPKERQPPSNHDIELAPQASCWTPERLELKAWLTRNAPSLAELYEGAICLLFEHRLPGYTRFVTHAAREIANRLPDAISAAGSAGKLQYSERLDQITEQWKKANPGGGNPFQSSETAVSSPGATPLEVAIPLDLFRLLENLIADHEAASEKVADAFRRMLIGRKTENQNFIPTLQPVVSQWRLVTRWFVSKAHDSGRVDADIDNTELLKKFELFERTLLAIIQQFFATTDALEQILKEANSSCAIPTSEQVERAIACIVHGEHNRYFFDRLENPQWLVPLEKKGFFKAPPAPIHDEPRGTIAFPIWPQSRYLARMTKVAPEAVAEIMTRIPETENIRVHDDFASAALALPPKLAAR